MIFIIINKLLIKAYFHVNVKSLVITQINILQEYPLICT